MPGPTQVFLEKKSCVKIADELSSFLADTYVLYIKTQNCHWNVIDPRFHSLHEMFEQQYQALAEAIDELAERIRMIGLKTPASMQEFLALSSLDEISRNDDLTGDDMIQVLLDDNESLIATIRPLIEQTAKLGDQGSSDFLIGRLRAHEKAAWMLRSHLSL